MIPLTNSFQLKNWIIKNNKENDSLNTLKILLRNKEYIFILCIRDYATIIFNENNNDFILKNNNDFYNLIKIFNNYQKSINHTFIEFSINLNNLKLNENNKDEEKQFGIIRCENCGFKVIEEEDYYSLHRISECEYSNRITCFFCFENFSIKDYIRHNEKLCFSKYLRVIKEHNGKNKNSLNDLNIKFKNIENKFLIQKRNYTK